MDDPSRPVDSSVPAEGHDSRVDAALHDYMERVDRGESLDTEKFVGEHPEIAGELRSLIDAEIQLRKFANAGGQANPPDDSTRSFALHGQETIAPQAGLNRGDAAEQSRRLKDQFGRYRIVRVLGQGAMGTVYLAEDTQLKRQVALKTPHFDKDPTGELLERLYREARAAATLRHPNICPVYDVGEIEGTHYISMAYIEGHPLSAFIRANKPQPERQVLIVVRKLAQALQEAHDLKVVHRDLKPANIMVDKRGEPLIMDFGLARHTRPDDDVRLTHSGTLVGTPAYMSPEQIDADSTKIGPLTDQYSLGVILFELLTGQLPFRGSMMAVLGQIVTKAPPSPSGLRPDLDPRIEAVCLKMMAKKPEDRLTSLSAVADELAAILRNPGTRPASAGKAASGLTPNPDGETASAAGAGSSKILKSAAVKSQILKTAVQKTLTAADLTSLEELARKCWTRHDYDQVIQIAERIPEQKRSESLNSLLEKARAKTDEIAFLLVDIDEAVRLEDRRTALKKAEALLVVKPGHRRALEVQERYSGVGASGIVRLSPRNLAQAWNEGGWVPWSVLAFGLAVVGVMAGVIIWWVNRTVIIIDSNAPGITVAIKGQKAFITAEGTKKIVVEPGDQEIKVSYEGLETVTREFFLKKGDSKILIVKVGDKGLLAYLQNEQAPDKAKTDVAQKGAAAGSIESPPPTLAMIGAAKGPRPASLAAPFQVDDAQSARQKWADYLHEPAETTNTLGMKFVLIPPGEFLMGTPADRFGSAQEKPQHRVRITRPYYLDTHEVTRGEFSQFVAASGYKTEAERDGGRAATFNAKGDLHEDQNAGWKNPGFEQTDVHPVVIVSWNDAAAFCRWLSEKEGATYRLPTEAEWEYACRAGTITAYTTGSHVPDLFKAGNGLGQEFRDHFHQKGDDQRPNDGFVFTAPVGSFPANSFGLFDMHGNAWEWCQDWFGGNYSPETAVDPTGAETGTKRVARGGGFDCGLSARSATRDSNVPTMRAANLGFRVARATREIAPVETASAEDAFVPLFNGRDLTGWKFHPSQPGNWRVENGILIGSGTQEGQPYVSERSHLYTERADFKNFHLRVEARINNGGNSGLYFRSGFGPTRPSDHPKFPSGYEAQIDSTVDPARTGSLYAGGNVVVGVSDTLVPPGQWFTEEVIAQGNRFVVKVNGQTTAVYRDEKEISASGHIALQQNNPKTIAEFRKIEIKELPAAALASGSARTSDAYVSLFNGENLNGWTRDAIHRGGWHVENGILSGGPAGEGSVLYSDRDDYKNFRLRVEARIKDKEASDLWIRTQIPPDDSTERKPPVGFEVDLREPTDHNRPRTGSIWAVRPKPDGGRSTSGFGRKEPMVQPGRWFTLEIVAEGNRVYALVDGALSNNTNWFKQDQTNTSGRIAIEQHVGEPSAEFRKIEIKELETRQTASINPRKVAPADRDALIAPFDESQAHAAQQKWSDRLKTPVELINKANMRMRLIPPGQFEMGSINGPESTQPRHAVRITRPFYLGTYEVTRAQFAAFVSATHSTGHSDSWKTGWRLDDAAKPIKWEPRRRFTWQSPGFTQDGSHPVVDVSWDDVQEFCTWLSRTEGKTYRLPTEAEWEYACRAGTTTAWYNGDTLADVVQIGNSADKSAKAKFSVWRTTSASDGFVYTSPVGQFRPNNFGLYDTIGNVLEWCSDFFDSRYYQNSPDADPTGPRGGKRHVARGGAFTSIGEAASRIDLATNHRAPDVGFRVVCEIAPVPPIVDSAPTGAPPTAGRDRQAWVGAESQFDEVAAGKWRETFPKQPGHAIYFFDQVAETPEYTELIDKTRIKSKGGVSVRLGDNQALMRWGGPSQEFKPLQPGQWVTIAEHSPTAAASQTVDRSFFNGRDLDGWHGLPGFWHVNDHALVGTVPVGQKAHTFLCSKREYKDFELKFRARLLGGVGNSGVQFRSKYRDAKTFWLVGPQCEICAQDRNRKYPTGSLVTEPTGEPSVAPAAADVDRIFKLADFNDFEIRCVGKHVRIKVNGLTTVDADFPSMPDEGLIGWQMHGKNPPREVTFKDIEFTDLSPRPARSGGL